MIVAHIVNDLLRELPLVSSHVSIYEEVTSDDLEAMLEYGHYCACEIRKLLNYI